MAIENPKGGGESVVLDLSPEQVTIMRENLSDWLEGVREDLKTPDKLADPERTRIEAAAWERLLMGVAEGRIAVPDETAREFLQAAAKSHDKVSGYAEVVAQHDAMHAVLAALEGSPGHFSGPPICLPATGEQREVQRRLLGLILSEHPLTVPVLGLRLMADPGDFEAGWFLIRALRDLVAAGLLQSDGLHVTPTRAALHFAQLRPAR